MRQRCRQPVLARLAVVAVATVACGGSRGDPQSDSTGWDGDESITSSGGSWGPDVGVACGDGVIDPGEDCDDGNDADADGCNADCKPSGRQLWAWLGPTEQDKAFDLAVDADGSTAVVGTGIPAWITKFDPEGIELWTSIPLVSSWRIAPLSGERYVVGANSPAQVYEVDAQTGQILTDFPTMFGDSLMEFDVGPDDAVYIASPGASANARVQIRTPGGDHIASFDPALTPASIAAGADGPVHVVGLANEGTVSIAKYNLPPAELWRFSVPLDQACCIRVTPDDDVVVAGYDISDEPGSGRVPWLARLDANGEVLWQVVLDPEAMGADSILPTGLAIDPAGDFVLVGQALVDSRQEAWVAKEDRDGKEKWHRIFRPVEWGEGPVYVAAVETGDGATIHVVGSVMEAPVNPTEERPWLAVLAP